MEHLQIAYDILVIMIGFAALAMAVFWALRTGQNELGNFSILYALFTLMLVVLVLRKYLFLNVADYSVRSWYTISGVYQVLRLAVVLAALYYFLEAHRFGWRRGLLTFFLVLMLVCDGLIFSPLGATLDVNKNIIRLGTGFQVASAWNLISFTCALILGYWWLGRVWNTGKRAFTLGLLIFATVGYLETTIGFFSMLRNPTATLMAEKDFVFSSIPYALYGIFLITYFLRAPISMPMGNEEPSQEFLSKYSITERERELITKVMQGKSNADIAHELFISQGTVKAHLHNIYQKLGVDSRYDLLARVRSNQ